MTAERVTVLSQAERVALYDLPDFDDFQRAEFFAMTEAERALVDRRKGATEQLHCLLQIGYFKAKQAFFSFSEREVPVDDIEFLQKRYFPGGSVALRPLRQSERYAQRAAITRLFGYRLWSDADRSALVEAAALLARRTDCGRFLIVNCARANSSTLNSILSARLCPGSE